MYQVFPYISADPARVVQKIRAEFIDAVIQPHETRLLLRKSMKLLRDKQISRVQRKHGLTPI
jgi:acetyl-CoA carboxylase carboxyltransferase component